MSTSTTPLVPLSDMDDVPVDLGVWRERVRNDASSFISLCLEAGLCPDLWSLYEWWDWLTPISVGHKRYDTIFYLCCLEKQPKVVLDNTEVTTLKVSTFYQNKINFSDLYNSEISTDCETVIKC